MPRDRTPRWGGAHKHEGPGKPRPRPLTPDEIAMRKLHGRLAAETIDELRARVQREINEMKENPPMPTPPPEPNVVFDESIGMWMFVHPVDGPCYVSGSFSEVQAAVYEYGFEPDIPSAEDVRNYEQFMIRQGEHAHLNEQMEKYLDSRAEPENAHIRVELLQRFDGQWELRAPNQEGGMLFGTSDEALDFTTNHGFTIFADGHDAREELNAAIERRRGEDPGSVGVEPPEPDPSLSPNGVMVDHDAPSEQLPDYVVDAMGPSPEPGPHPVDHGSDDGAPDENPPVDYAGELRAAAASSPDPAVTNTTALVVSQMPEADSLARASTSPERTTPTSQLKPSNGLKLTRR
jgi:hypothetical protein